MTDERWIVLTGYMGSGKTTVGKALSKALDLPFTDLDDQIEQVTGCAIWQIFAEKGETSFREIEAEELKRVLSSKPGVLALGGGTVLSSENRRQIKDSGACAVWLQIEPKTVLKRLQNDEMRPLLKANSEEERLLKIRHMIHLRKEAYEDAADVVISVDGRTVEEIVEEITAWIR